MILELIGIFTNMTPRVCDAKKVAETGSVNAVRWLETRFGPITQEAKEAVLNVAFFTGNRPLIEHIFAEPIHLRHERPRLGLRKDVAFVEWVLKEFRPEVTSDDICDAVRHSTLPVIQLLSKGRPDLLTYEVMLLAAQYASLDVIQWLHQHHLQPLSVYGFLMNALQSSHRKGQNEAVVEWLLERGYPLTDMAPFGVVRIHDVGVMRLMQRQYPYATIVPCITEDFLRKPETLRSLAWLREKTMMNDDDLVQIGISTGDVRVLMALKEASYTFRGLDIAPDGFCPPVAAASYLHGEGAVMTNLDDVVRNAVSFANMDRLAWLCKQYRVQLTTEHFSLGLEGMEMAAEVAAEYGVPAANFLAFIVWLDERTSSPPDAAHVMSVVKNGCDFDVLQYLLYRRGDPVPAAAMLHAAKSGHVACLKILHVKQTSAPDMAGVLNAIATHPRRGFIDVLDWLFQVSPVVALAPFNGYVTIDDIVAAHAKATTKAVAIWLEKHYPIILPKKIASTQNKERTEAAFGAIAKYLNE